MHTLSIHTSFQYTYHLFNTYVLSTHLINPFPITHPSNVPTHTLFNQSLYTQQHLQRPLVLQALKCWDGSHTQVTPQELTTITDDIGVIALYPLIKEYERRSLVAQIPFSLNAIRRKEGKVSESLILRWLPWQFTVIMYPPTLALVIVLRLFIRCNQRILFHPLSLSYSLHRRWPPCSITTIYYPLIRSPTFLSHFYPQRLWSHIPWNVSTGAIIAHHHHYYHHHHHHHHHCLRKEWCEIIMAT